MLSSSTARAARLLSAVVAATCLLTLCPAGVWSAERLAGGSRPNILLIVADDLGYQDLGVFGSEIHTPRLDGIAASGMVMTNFYATPVCATTRAMLMSGMDNHQAGVGAMATKAMYPENSPYYQGAMTDRTQSIAARLAELNYHTYVAGKWHLGEEPGQDPVDRGFEKSFVLLDPSGSHWADMGGNSATEKAKYTENGARLISLPKDFYSTISYTDKMIEYIDGGIADGKPFFGYLAYTAPHWPLHAPDADIARQTGRYDEGYDVIRARRFERWKHLGFGARDTQLAPDPVDVVHWEKLSAADRAKYAKAMEVYAAMVERMDSEIGRLLDHLKKKGVLDSTLVIFMSDNGAEGMNAWLAGFDNSLENIGRPGSFTSIGPGWAGAGAAPFFLRKTFVSEGGIHVPAFISAPALGVKAGRSNALASVMDLGPTFVDLAGGQNTPGGTAKLKMTGVPFTSVLRGKETGGRPKDDELALEVNGGRAIRRWPWKAEWMFPPQGKGEWQLYNLEKDPTQRKDMAQERPDILKDLVERWEKFADENGVIRLQERRRLVRPANN